MIERINLVPQKPLSDRIKQTTPVVVGLLLALIVVFIFAKSTFLSHRIKKLDKELKTVQEQINNAEILQIEERTLTSEVIRLREQQAELQLKSANVSKIQTEKRSLTSILTRITEALPSSVICKNISFHGNAGQITGEALFYSDVPDIVNTLNNDPMFLSATLQDIDRGLENVEDARLIFNIVFEMK